MRFLPVMLDVAARRVLVVGGGTVATGKVARLREAAAQVRVVALEASAELTSLCARDSTVSLETRAFRDVDLDGVDLVFTATGDPAVTEQVAEGARRRGLWMNAADDPARCTFLLPATIERGALQVAVSSGGASPTLAKRVRDEIDAALGPEYARAAELLGELRRELPTGDERRRALGQLLDGGLLEALRQGDDVRVARLTEAARRGFGRAAAGGGAD